jgi:hypothetical protein
MLHLMRCATFRPLFSALRILFNTRMFTYFCCSDGRVLDDLCTLGDYSVQAESTLTLAVPLAGGKVDTLPFIAVLLRNSNFILNPNFRFTALLRVPERCVARPPRLPSKRTSLSASGAAPSVVCSTTGGSRTSSSVPVARRRSVSAKKFSFGVWLLVLLHCVGSQHSGH